MSALRKKSLALRYRSTGLDRGSVVIEVSLLIITFFGIVFGMLEFARAMYVINTLHAVTRSAAAAAATSAFDPDTLDRIRRQAMVVGADGNLILGKPVSPDHIRIDYLSLSRDVSSGAITPMLITTMPSCPARNRLNCLADPYGASCIRLVRVRICQSGEGERCDRVPYDMLFPLVDLSSLKLPTAETIVTAHTMGYSIGSIPCP
ncbi:TadE/TadG family type IV pilus assembly protein [Massilia sp. TN1-12]|uniref:TadE/TadG family type IV pilus assembly protein n=1 Tax=Massilia paldalensis TaxID=3377675 RepID=UPI00384B5AE7